MYISPLAEETKRQYDRMLRRRDCYRDVFQLLSKYILMREIWWGDTSMPGLSPRITVKDVSDDTVVDAARTSATALGGALWPNTSESFELVPHPLMEAFADAAALNSQTVKAYYAEATRRARQPFDAPESNFLLSWGEHLDDQVVFGTSGILGVEDEYDDDNPCCFRSVSIETALIEEGPKGSIDTVCFEFALTVRQVVEKYGIDNVSKATRDRFNTQQFRDEYVKVIQMIRPRPKGKKGAPKWEKPFASIHMEVPNQHILKHDGMDELPAFIVRFRKRPTEMYGRSLAMDALPSVRELNVLRGFMNLALQKQLKPPIGFRVDMLGGAGTVDLSPDAKNAIYDTGQIPQGRPLVEQLMQIPEPRVAAERCKDLLEQIMVKFLIDRLLDFNNKTRMTKGEAEMRLDFRNQALGSLFSRQIIELLDPLIKWVIGVFWRRRKLGMHPVRDAVEIMLLERSGIKPFVMPQVVADFYDRYNLLPFAPRFISPAARAMRADSLLGLERLTNYVLTLINAGQFDAIDNIDSDYCIQKMQELYGAPQDAIRSRDKRDKARNTRQEELAQRAALEAQEQQSQIGKNAAKAAKDFAQAGMNPQGAMVA